MKIRFDHAKAMGRSHAARRGFSLVEMVLSVVLVGGLLVVAMNMLGASKLTQRRYADREVGLLLAEALLEELTLQAYQDPDETTTTLGPESDEVGGTRAGFDDVDDYAGWSATPPVDLDGVAIVGADRFSREVVVTWQNLNDPKAAESAESGLKLVRVTVRVGAVVVAELAGARTAHWPAAQRYVEALQ